MFDMANYIAYIIAMMDVNIADLKNNLSKYIAYVEQGRAIRICKRNKPIANLTPLSPESKGNRTKLGCGMGSAVIHGDLTEPMIPEDSWETLGQ